MQKPLFIIGWGFLLAAFASAALESMSPMLGVRSWPVISAKDLWHTVFPAGYVLFKGYVEDVSPFLWDPVLASLLWLPAWALFLAPGAFLTLYFRPNRVLRPDQERELQRQRESLFLYDELARRAADEAAEDAADTGAADADAAGDDLEPRHFVVENMYSKDELETWDSAEGAPPDEHDVFGNLNAPGTVDLTPDQPHVQTVEFTVQPPAPPADNKNAENAKDKDGKKE